MAEICRAAVITRFNEPLEIRQVQIPELEPGGMLARVEAATLCGTDVHRWHGSLGIERSIPFIPGHETCGIVVELNGPRTDLLGRPLQEGDRVLWAYPSCGHCYYCTVARQTTLCSQKISWGHQKIDDYPYLLGGLAEYQYAPPASAVISVPDEVSSDLAASAACALRTVMSGFERLGAIASHEIVVIQGAGPLGLYATAVARDHGANRVLVIGAPSTRLDVAQELGADAVLDLEQVPDPKDRIAWVRDQSGGRGGDVVIQVASGDSVGEGLMMVRPGGRYVSIGQGGKNSVPLEALGRAVSYVNIQQAEPRHWLQAVNFLATRRSLPFDRIITGSFGLEDASEAFRLMANYTIVKPVIYPQQLPSPSLAETGRGEAKGA
jgi:threonine dehydrogenase-like Zn-dependent dehydrogenase